MINDLVRRAKYTLAFDTVSLGSNMAETIFFLYPHSTSRERHDYMLIICHVRGQFANRRL